MFKNILIPTDGSALSKKAITNGVKLARSLGAKVTGLWVAPGYDPQIYEDYVPANYMSPADYKVEIGKRAEQILSAVQKAADAAGVPCETHHAMSSFPYEAIIKAAKAKKCDAIFMASHGRSGIKGFLLGSETTKVLTHSKIPVIVYR